MQEHRIAAWLCQNASSFVLFDTKPRATVIAFEDDAAEFRREFVSPLIKLGALVP